MENINRVCSIEVSVEMIMYGYSSLSIYESEDL